MEAMVAGWPAAMPTTVAERLKAIQDRIWAMHDALLTIRLPFETFYNSLTDELRQRLRREELESAGAAAGTREGRGENVARKSAPTSAEPAGGNPHPVNPGGQRAPPPKQQQAARGGRLGARVAATA